MSFTVCSIGQPKPRSTLARSRDICTSTRLVPGSKSSRHTARRSAARDSGRSGTRARLASRSNLAKRQADQPSPRARPAGRSGRSASSPSPSCPVANPAAPQQAGDARKHFGADCRSSRPHRRPRHRARSSVRRTNARSDTTISGRDRPAIDRTSRTNANGSCQSRKGIGQQQVETAVSPCPKPVDVRRQDHARRNPRPRSRRAMHPRARASG